MNSYRIKIRHIVPFTATIILTMLVAYSLLRWVVTVILGLDWIKSEVWNFCIPLFLTVIIGFLSANKLRIIYESDTGSLGYRTVLHTILASVSFVTLVCSQLFIEQKNQKTAYIERFSAFDSISLADCYQVDDFIVNAEVKGVYVERRSMYHRFKETVTFNVYAVYPFVGTDNLWYAVQLHKRIEQGLFEKKKVQQQYRDFILKCSAELGSYDFGDSKHFRRVRESDMRDGFAKALKNVEMDYSSKIDIENAIFLLPVPDEEKDISTLYLLITICAFLVGIGALFLTLYFAKTDPKIITPKGRLRKQKPNKGWGSMLGVYLIPGRSNWTLIVIFYSIIVLFLVMTLSGVNMFAPSEDDLYRWGALVSGEMAWGEWWRFVSYMFVHCGLYHVVVNVMGFYLAIFFSFSLYDSYRLSILFLISGVVAGTVVCAIDHTLLVGASGAIMGLYGAILTSQYCSNPTRRVLAVVCHPLFAIVGITLFLGLMLNVSNISHIAGLITGVLLELLLFRPLSARS